MEEEVRTYRLAHRIYLGSFDTRPPSGLSSYSPGAIRRPLRADTVH